MATTKTATMMEYFISSTVRAGFADKFLTLAASSATAEEEALAAKGKFEDGTTPIQMERRVWRAQVKSQYVEPESDIDPTDQLDYVYVNAGKTVLRNKNKLPDRDDIIEWNQAVHQEQFDTNIQWRDCPKEHAPVIEWLLKRYWEPTFEKFQNPPYSVTSLNIYPFFS
jgi:hypothetical protein